MHPNLDINDNVFERFPGILHRHWYIVSCVVTIPLIYYYCFLPYAYTWNFNDRIN